MSHVLAVELAPFAIRVNAISPGIIDTSTVRPLLGDDGSAIRNLFIKSLLVPRIGLPADVVNAAVFLASDEASYITGVNLHVDGGWSASGGLGMVSEEVTHALSAGAGADRLAAN